MDCGSESGIRCFLGPWVRDPEQFFPIPESNLQVGNNFFWLKILKFFLNRLESFSVPGTYLFNKNLNTGNVQFCEINGHLLVRMLSFAGSGIRDPGSEIRDPGSGAENYPDPGYTLRISNTGLQLIRHRHLKEGLFYLEPMAAKYKRSYVLFRTCEKSCNMLKKYPTEGVEGKRGGIKK